jgi:hypothetical protein
MAKISAPKIKRYGDNRSPCLQPRPIWKNSERLPPWMTADDILL